MTVAVKICGLNTPEAVAAAATADYAGFVFFPRSPRHVGPEQAGALAAALPASARRVAVTVDADDTLIAAIMGALRPDLIQLHGRETPQRARDLAARFGVGTIKAFAIADPGDLDATVAYADAVDWFLFDAKPPARAGALPGGNAASFDWRMLAGRMMPRPWFLSGGLDADNVRAAMTASGARAVDVSSGVEASPGRKDPARVAAFLRAARA
jgi:phosphoribosylanthranilate isomerase